MTLEELQQQLALIGREVQRRQQPVGGQAPNVPAPAPPPPSAPASSMGRYLGECWAATGQGFSDFGHWLWHLPSKMYSGTADWYARRRGRGRPAPSSEAAEHPRPRAPARTWGQWFATWRFRIQALANLFVIGWLLYPRGGHGPTPKERFAEYYAAFSDFEHRPDGCPWGSKMVKTWKFNQEGWISECRPTTDFAWDELQLNMAFTASLKAVLGTYLGMDPKTSWTRPIADLFIESITHAQSQDKGLDAQLIMHLSKLNHIYAQMQAERKLYESKRSAELEAFALPLTQGQKRIEETLSGAHRMMNQLALDVTKAVRDEALRSGKVSQMQLEELERRIQDSQDANTLSLSKQMQGIGESVTRLKHHCDDARKRCEEALKLVEKARKDGIIENTLDTQHLTEQLQDKLEDLRRWGLKTGDNLFRIWPWLVSGWGLFMAFCSWLPFWGWSIVLFVFLCVVAVASALLKKALDMVQGGLSLVDSLKKATEKLMELLASVLASPFRAIGCVGSAFVWALSTFMAKLKEALFTAPAAPAAPAAPPAPPAPRPRSPRAPRTAAAQSEATETAPEGSTAASGPEAEAPGDGGATGTSASAARIVEEHPPTTTEAAAEVARAVPVASPTPPSAPTPPSGAPNQNQPQGRSADEGPSAPSGGPRQALWHERPSQEDPFAAMQAHYPLPGTAPRQGEAEMGPPNIHMSITAEELMRLVHGQEGTRRGSPGRGRGRGPGGFGRGGGRPAPAPRPVTPIFARPRPEWPNRPHTPQHRQPGNAGPSLQASAPPRTLSQEICTNCGQRGHGPSQCPEFVARVVVPPPVPAEGTQRAEGSGEQPQVQVVERAEPGPGAATRPSVYHVKAKLGTRLHPMQMLVDSGSSVCLLPLTKCTSGGWTVRPLEQPMQVRAFNNSLTAVCGTVDVAVDLGGTSRPVSFLVVDGIDKPILGTDALQKFELALDFAHDRLVTTDGDFISCSAVHPN